MRWLSTLMAIAPAMAQLSPSVTTLTFVERQNGPSPFAQTFSIGGTGNISLGACSGNFYQCTYETLTFSPSSAPSTATVSFTGYQTASTPGLQTWTQVINGSAGGSFTLTMNLNVVAYTAPTFSSPSGTFAGCSNSTATYFDLDVCTFQGGITPGPSPFNMFPGAGSSYIDPNFGGKVTQITHSPPVFYSLWGDSANSAINSSNTLIAVSDLGGGIHILSTADGSEPYPHAQSDWTPPVKAPMWSSLDPLVIYYFSGLSVHKYNLASRADSIVATYSGGPGNTTIHNGGNNNVSKDEWTCFFPDGDNLTVLLNLSTGVMYDTGSWPTFPDAGNSGHLYKPRSCDVTVGVNQPDGNRYFMQNFNAVDQTTGGSIFEKYHLTPGGAIVDDGIVGPANPMAGEYGYPNACTPTMLTSQLPYGLCFNPGHLSLAESQGVQYLVFADGMSPPFVYSMYWARFDRALMTTPVEEDPINGGMYVSLPINTTDTHVSCAKTAPVCVVGTDGDTAAPSSITTITGVTANGVSPIVLTTGSAYPGSIGDAILVGGVYCSDGTSHAANGAHTVAAETATTVTLENGTASTCTYSSVIPDSNIASGRFIPNVAPAQTASHQMELVAIDGARIGAKQFHVYRIAKSRAFAFNDLSSAYYSQSHPVISGDATLIGWESNNGTPDTMGVFTAPSGYSPIWTSLRGLSLRGFDIR